MNDRINNVTKNPAAMAALSGVMSLGVGVLFGYIWGRRAALNEELQDDYPIVSVAESDLSEETLKMLDERRRNGTRVSVIQGARPTKIVADEDTEDPKEIVIDHVEEDEEEEPTLVSRTVFAQDGPDWDMEAELAQRTPDAPYVLHQDEFYDSDTENLQLTFTYYAMDNVLADQDEVVVHLPENRVGPFYWGHGSTDRNRFFVRNEERKEEYEIIREPDKYYMVEVQGLELEEVEETELQHSATPKMRPLE